MSDHAIADHAFLSDCRSSALVSRDGSVDWLTFPRFDAPSVFARLLDQRAGHFRVGPADPDVKVSRRYVDGSLVLETSFETAHGRLRLTDALAVGAGERGHDLGRDAPHALLRHAVCEQGHVDLEVEFSPRPEYGRTRPLLCGTDHGVTTRGGPDALTLTTDVALSPEHGTAIGHRPMVAGDTASFALQWSRAWEEPPEPFRATDVAERLQDTLRAWSTWSDQHQRYAGPWAGLVKFSGAVLQGLTFQPTGAIVAAPTTSLPESIGGTRNWDYRFAWLRDASMTLDALWVAACPDEAHSFVQWLVGAAAADLRNDAPIQIMYGVGGEHDLAERTLDHLNGWRGSRPVRVGNGAFDQRQLDVYGEVLDATFRLREQLRPFDPTTARFLVDLADAAANQWPEPDQGIWEVRGGPRHFLYSKLMCWVALDRALELVDDLDPDHGTVDRWHREREAVAEAILDRGYDSQLGAFTQSFDSPVLDASALRIPQVGFLPGDDPRVRSTIASIEAGLTDERGFVYRYRDDDGLPGDEGTFLLCTFWLAHAHALAGDVDRARELFELAVSVRNDVLRIGYGVAMVGLAALLVREPTTGHGANLTHADDGDDEDGPQRSDPLRRHVVTTDGSSYRYRAVGLLGQGALSGGGAVMAGLISTGVGEATLPGLVRRSGFPLPVAAATSTVVVAATVAGAALTHLVELGRQGGFSAIPWNLLVWAVPGAVMGAFIGTFLQGRVSERITRLFFAGLFGIIGLVFLAVFGLGVGAESLA